MISHDDSVGVWIPVVSADLEHHPFSLHADMASFAWRTHLGSLEFKPNSLNPVQCDAKGRFFRESPFCILGTLVPVPKFRGDHAQQHEPCCFVLRLNQ